MNRRHLYIPIFASVLAVSCGGMDPTMDSTIEEDEVVGEATETVRATAEKVLCHIDVHDCTFRGCKVEFYAARRAEGWRKVSLGHIRCRSRNPACDRKVLDEYKIIVEHEGYVPLVTPADIDGVDKCHQPFD